MKRNIENAMFKKDINCETRCIDLSVGDVVQIKRTCINGGRIGKVIGVSLNSKGNHLNYTVKFSDNESVIISGWFLDFISKNDDKYLPDNHDEEDSRAKE